MLYRVRDDELFCQRSSTKHHITQSVGFTMVPSQHHLLVQQEFIGNERAPKPEASNFDSDCIQDQQKCVSADDVSLKLSAVSSADVATTKIGLPSTSGMIDTTSTTTDSSSPLCSSVSNDTPIKCGKPGSSTPSHSRSTSKSKSELFSDLTPLSKPTYQEIEEKDEEVIYCQRAKLFVFSDGEWKEQGVGNINILRRTSTGENRYSIVIKIVIVFLFYYYVRYLKYLLLFNIDF